mgnify:CR=1 FL=1
MVNLFGKSMQDLKDKNIAVNPRRCPQNHPCPSVRVCPAGAITQEGFGLPEVDMEKCVKCGRCVQYCPMGAIYAE